MTAVEQYLRFFSLAGTSAFATKRVFAGKKLKKDCSRLKAGAAIWTLPALEQSMAFWGRRAAFGWTLCRSEHPPWAESGLMQHAEADIRWPDWKRLEAGRDYSQSGVCYLFFVH